MRRILVSMLALSALLQPLSAQVPESEDLKARIVANGRKISGIECDFVQTKESALLAEPAVSSGKMVYCKPSHLEWTYTEPFNFSFILDGDNAVVENNGSRQSFDVRQNRMLKEMSRMIIACIGGSTVAGDDLFRSEISEKGNSVELTLYPLGKDAKKMWRKLVLHYEKDSLKVNGFEMEESSGDITRIVFKNTKYAFAQ